MEKRILVIGDSCIDVYSYCKSDRLAPDKPVQVLEVIDTVETPGMAFNVFNNALSLSNNPKGVDLLTNPNYQEIIKNRYVDKASNHMFVRVDSSTQVERLVRKEIEKEYLMVSLSVI